MYNDVDEILYSACICNRSYMDIFKLFLYHFTDKDGRKLDIAQGWMVNYIRVC